MGGHYSGDVFWTLDKVGGNLVLQPLLIKQLADSGAFKSVACFNYFSSSRRSAIARKSRRRV